MNYKNKVAYITGGTKGIGLSVAKHLVKKGMRVAISGRKKQTIETALTQISNDSSKVLGIVSDVSIFENEKNAVQQIIKYFGQLDVVLANAGVGHFAPIHELSETHWNQMINTNLTGAFHTLKSCFSELKKSKGYYITLASLAGTNFFANGAGYNASKFGLVGFTQASMLDLRTHGIKVTTIMPGSVATHFNNNTPSKKDEWKIQPEDIGVLVWDLLQMHPRTLPSKIEVRPTRPDLKNK